MLRTLMITLAAMAVATGGVARADVVMPPPKTCPEGATPSTCHGGPYCKPEVCSSTTGCPPGTACKSKELCIDQINCGGKVGPVYNDAVKDTCPGGVPCKVGTCKTVSVCIIFTCVTNTIVIRVALNRIHNKWAIVISIRNVVTIHIAITYIANSIPINIGLI